MTGQTVRAFVAVELPDSLRAAVDSALAGHRRDIGGLRWVPAGNLHLTAKFLGQVEAGRVDEFVRATARACELHRPFEIRLKGWGVYPPRGMPRVLWLGVEQGRAEFRRLAQEVDRQLAKRGIPAETRPPSPHLTVARWPRDAARGGPVPATIPMGLPEAGFEAFTVAALSFMSSDLRQGGPVYGKLAEVPLGEGG